MFSVDHYAISITDAVKSISFYQKLGFSVVKDWTDSNNSVRIVHMLNGYFLLEMFCYKDHGNLPDFVDDLSSDLKVVGSKHFGLQVDDLQTAANYLVDVGILDAMPKFVPGRLGRAYFFIKDPDGIFVEIIEKRS